MRPTARRQSSWATMTALATLPISKGQSLARLTASRHKARSRSESRGELQPAAASDGRGGWAFESWGREMWTVIKVSISLATIVLVSASAQRSPRLAAVLLSLPLVSILAFVFTWTENYDLKVVSRLARETLVLVPLGLPFFIPL